MVDLDELDRLHAAAFRAPWRAETWTVETDDGDDRDVETILAPDEYPSEQVVAQVGPDGQIETPGLGSLAARNAAAIAAMHNAYPVLAAEVRALRERVARQDAELVALREAVLAGEAAVRSSANAIDDYHADAFAVALAKVPR